MHHNKEWSTELLAKKRKRKLKKSQENICMSQPDTLKLPNTKLGLLIALEIFTTSVSLPMNLCICSLLPSDHS